MFSRGHFQKIEINSNIFYHLKDVLSRAKNSVMDFYCWSKFNCLDFK